MFRLAERTSRIDASGIRRVFDLARELKDPINLSIGQPDFAVPDAIKQAAVTAIHADHNGYTPTQGLAPLREQIQAAEADASGRSWADDEVLITSGVSGGLFLALLATVEPGVEVVIPDPYFVMYKHLVALFGGTPVYLDTYGTDFLPSADALERVMTERTGLVLLNSPANPTGRVLQEAHLKALAEVCQRHQVPVLSDEIYRGFAYQSVPSMAAYYDQTVVLGGYSKTFAMTGWRLGYAAGPSELIQAMAMVQQYSFVCAPSVTQWAALACPTVDVSEHIDRYRAKRDLMTELLSRSFTVVPAEGAFYLWVQAPDGWEDGDQFCEQAIANGVLVIPGSVFSEQRSHFRVCYTVDDSVLRAGADVLCRLADGVPSAS